MKKLILLLLFIPFFYSCKSAIISTHNQEMNKLNTKQKVLNRFGIPDDKSFEGEIEQWLYDYGSRTVTSNYNPSQTANTTARYNSYTDQINVNTTVNASTGYTRTNTYRKYAKFLIDKNGNVRTWRTQGLDFQIIDKKQRLKNILYPSVGIVLVAIIWAVLDEAAFQKELDQEDWDYWND